MPALRKRIASCLKIRNTVQYEFYGAFAKNLLLLPH